VARASALSVEVNGRKVDGSGAKTYLDAVKWASSKMAPRTHGDKIAHEHAGPGGGPIEYSRLSPEQRAVRIAELEAKRKAEAGDGPVDR